MAKKTSRWQKVTIKGDEYVRSDLVRQSERKRMRKSFRRKRWLEETFIEFAKKPADYHWRSDEETVNLIDEAVDEVYKKWG